MHLNTLNVASFLVLGFFTNSHVIGEGTCQQGEGECSPDGAQTLDYTRCSEMKKPSLDEEPQQWQRVPGREVMVFSAFMERRAVAGGPAIRIVGSGLQAQFQEIGNLYCQLWYDDKEEAFSVGPADYILIYPSTLHPDMWVSHFILCPLPKYLPGVPSMVSISPDPCNAVDNALMVLGREDQTVSETFALCISPIYNNFRNWLTVIEWVEIHKLIGANEISLYNLSVSEETNQVLAYYANDPSFRVNVIQWPFPQRWKSNVWCQRGALNDCLYRMGLKHLYVAITDLDEVLTPRMSDTWQELLPQIHSPRFGAFLFQHAYFRRNNTGESPYLITQQSLWRTDEVTPPGKIRCKSMYKSSKTIKIDLHFPYELVQGAEEYILPPEEGILHHYRQDPMETFRKNPEKFTFIEDSYMHKYRDQLQNRVRDVIKSIGLQ